MEKRKNAEKLSNSQILEELQKKQLNELNSLNLNSFVDYYFLHLRDDNEVLKHLREVLDTYVIYIMENQFGCDETSSVYNTALNVLHFLESLKEQPKKPCEFRFIENY